MEYKLAVFTIPPGDRKSQPVDFEPQFLTENTDPEHSRETVWVEMQELDGTIIDINGQKFLPNPVVDTGGRPLPPDIFEDWIPWIGTDQQVKPIKVDAAVDLNRDGEILFDGSDKTSASKAHAFWLNNDRDRGITVDGSDWEEDDLQVTSPFSGDSYESTIYCQRDLEDFIRIWVDFTGLLQHINIQDGTYGINARWKNVTTGGTMAVKLYQPDSQSLDYLNDDDVGHIQVTDDDLKKELCTVSSAAAAASIPERAWRQHLSAQSPVLPLLFEGHFAGKGELVFEVVQFPLTYAPRTVATTPPIHLDLGNVERLYETWSVGEANLPGIHHGVHPASSAELQTLPGGALPPPQSEEEKDYILFVHGWNLPPWEKRAFASTMFKRLWHQGYKGRFGCFLWPAFWEFDSAWDVVAGEIDHFDASEHRAWKCGAPLKLLVEQLARTYSIGGNSRVRLYAHSMGNIVVGECLRAGALAGSPVPAHTYIAAQAAISAHVYDIRCPTMNWSLTPPYPSTPNVYGYHWVPGVTSGPGVWQAEGRPCYMAPIAAAGVTTMMINHYNPKDWALATFKWQLNQMFKPDNDYDYHSGSDEFGHSPMLPGPLPIPGPRRVLNFPGDRFEIFSYAAESRSFALGTTGPPGAAGDSTLGPFSSSVDLWSAFGFDAAHKFHSGQFRSTIQKRWTYWRKVLQDLDLVP